MKSIIIIALLASSIVFAEDTKDKKRAEEAFGNCGQNLADIIYVNKNTGQNKGADAEALKQQWNNTAAYCNAACHYRNEDLGLAKRTITCLFANCMQQVLHDTSIDWEKKAEIKKITKDLKSIVEYAIGIAPAPQDKYEIMDI